MSGTVSEDHFGRPAPVLQDEMYAISALQKVIEPLEAELRTVKRMLDARVRERDDLIGKYKRKALAHVAGGGSTEGLPRGTSFRPNKRLRYDRAEMLEAAIKAGAEEYIRRPPAQLNAAAFNKACKDLPWAEVEEVNVPTIAVTLSYFKYHNSLEGGWRYERPPEYEDDPGAAVEGFDDLLEGLDD